MGNPDARPVTAEELLVEAMARAINRVDSGWADRYTYDRMAAAALEAIRAAEGYALVRLPEPTEPEHQRPWRLMPEALWRVSRCEVTASFDGIDPKIGVGWDSGGGLGFPTRTGRPVALAMLAACDHAERLADEHNTAAQDAEDASRG